ncbi:MAG: hypothetical protein NTZ48_03895, partial [Candidatus Omnitrophica bacterium]|nr:hypothetical protein [Candidatus Omnitrophota bacterium]
KQVRGLPVIDAKNLLSGVAKPGPIQVQISRWCKSGKLIKLKNNIYLLSEDFRKLEIYEFHIASLLKKPSYISLEKALEYYGFIPEAVAVYTSVTTKRPGKVITAIGTFDYRHIKNSLFWGYKPVTVNRQLAFIAYPEKALLDFFYLKGLRIDEDYLDEMRLQNLKGVNFKRLLEFSGKFKSPGVLKVAQLIKKYAMKQKKEEKPL